MEQFYDYFYNCYDTLISESPNTSFIVVGDFNPTGNGFHLSPFLTGEIKKLIDERNKAFKQF